MKKNFMLPALLLVACSNDDKIPEKKVKDNVVVNPPIFTLAFQDGHEEVDGQGYRYIFRNTKVGDLKLPSGKLVICEPLYFSDEEPIDERIEPGTYPVYLAEATISKDGKVTDKRNALAKIKLAHGVATKWEFIWSFSADGGTGGYIDYVAKNDIVGANKSEEFSNSLLNEFEEASKIVQPFENNYENYRQYVNLDVPSGNLIAFSSGWGDGGYNSYFGYDASGKLVEVLTDLSIIEWPSDKFVISR